MSYLPTIPPLRTRVPWRSCCLLVACSRLGRTPRHQIRVAPDPAERSNRPAPLPRKRTEPDASLRLPRTPHLAPGGPKTPSPLPPPATPGALCYHHCASEEYARPAEQVHSSCQSSGNYSIEAPAAVAWNSTAVNRCSGAQPHAVSRPQRPTDSTLPGVDRQGNFTIARCIATPTRIPFSSGPFPPYTHAVIEPFRIERRPQKRHASPGHRNNVIAVHRHRKSRRVSTS